MSFYMATSIVYDAQCAATHHNVPHHTSTRSNRVCPPNAQSASHDVSPCFRHEFSPLIFLPSRSKTSTLGARSSHRNSPPVHSPLRRAPSFGRRDRRSANQGYWPTSGPAYCNGYITQSTRSQETRKGLCYSRPQPREAPAQGGLREQNPSPSRVERGFRFLGPRGYRRMGRDGPE